MKHPMDLNSSHIQNLLEKCPTLIRYMLRLVRFYQTGKHNNDTNWTCSDFLSAIDVVFAYQNFTFKYNFPYKTDEYNKICSTEIYKDGEFLTGTVDCINKSVSKQQAIIDLILNDKPWGAYDSAHNYPKQFLMIDEFVEKIPFLAEYRAYDSPFKQSPNDIVNGTFVVYCICLETHIVKVITSRDFKLNRILAC